MMPTRAVPGDWRAVIERWQDKTLACPEPARVADPVGGHQGFDARAISPCNGVQRPAKFDMVGIFLSPSRRLRTVGNKKNNEKCANNQRRA
jgi:hypothetical protein